MELLPASTKRKNKESESLLKFHPPPFGLDICYIEKMSVFMFVWYELCDIDSSDVNEDMNTDLITHARTRTANLSTADGTCS